MKPHVSINRATRDRFRYELPYPLSINYKRLGACPDPNAQRLLYILKTAEMTARFLGIVALAELRRAAPEGGLRGRGTNFSTRFQLPSFGTWLWILRESLVALHAANATLFLPELDAFYFDAHRKPTPAARHLDALCTTRNRFAHDQVPADEWLQPRQIPEICETAVPALEHVLHELMFLAERPLIVASPVTAEKKRGQPPQFVRNKIVMVGCADPFDVDRDTVTELCETAQALILKPGSSSYLNLDPLIIYSNDGMDIRDIDGHKREVRSEIYDVFMWNGGRAGNRRYIACGKGGELSTSGREDEDYVEAAITDLLAAVGERE